MSTPWIHLAPPDDSASSAARTGRRTPGVPAVVWAQNADTRLLLRGLLRLHHHPVVQEIRAREELDHLSGGSEARILLYDAEVDTPTWSEELADTLQRHPEFRAVVILPREAPSAGERARAAGAKAVVSRPFAIHDLLTAVGKAATLDADPTPLGR